MINRRLGATIVALPLALALAACGSDSTAGSPDTGGPTSAPATSAPASSSTSTSPSSSTTESGSTTAPGSSSSAGSGSAVDAAELVSNLRAGLESVKSVHLQATSTNSGQTQTVTGDETISDGKVTAADIRAGASGQSFALRIVGSQAWGKLPNVGTASKPWVLISESSSNPTVRIFAKTLSSLTGSLGLDQSVQFLSASASVRNAGTTSVNGTTATHYAAVVDYRKLPASYPNKKLLLAAGVTSAPVDIYLDDQGRPVRVDTKVTVSNQTTTSTVLLSKYNQPVSITPPPAGQVTK